MQLNREELLAAYTRMRTIREFEERVAIEFATGDLEVWLAVNHLDCVADEVVTRSCGVNLKGRQSRLCDGGWWQDWSECDMPGGYVEDTSSAEACANGCETWHFSYIYSFWPTEQSGSFVVDGDEIVSLTFEATQFFPDDCDDVSSNTCFTDLASSGFSASRSSFFSSYCFRYSDFPPVPPRLQQHLPVL